MKKVFVSLLLLIMPVTLTAQTSSASQASEMRKLTFLVGKWKGEGWVMSGAGERRTFTTMETVESKLDGLLVVFEGLGKDEKGATVHNAFAVASYDEKARLFRWRAYRVGGEWLDAEPTVSENSLVWGFGDSRSGGDIRFTIKLNERGQWFEIGEYSRDGKAWQKFFEMTLNRVK